MGMSSGCYSMVVEKNNCGARALGYHGFRFEESRFSSKDLLDHLPPPVVPVIRHPPPLDRDSSAGRSSGKNSRRGRDRRSAWKFKATPQGHRG
ncbi:hypothetical protein D5086_015108 [Populus alba]|uniref:Uncharacterized protein n=1 Tax=Populus alba TaxID=43335 RepID=A0ACC4C0Y1_POPAL